MSVLLQLPPEFVRRRVIGTKDAAAFCGLSVVTLRRMRGRGEVPSPIHLSERRLGWRLGDLVDWLDARARGLAWADFTAMQPQNDNQRIAQTAAC